MSKDTGGPAFPATNHHGHKLEGMTLRDYFAGNAIQGLLADPAWRRDMDFEETAWAAYEQADAMLKARKT
jgi:hypothetical protein